MTNNPPVPTLSTHGWVTNTAEKIDFLLAHWVESDAEQDTIYGSNVSNLQEIVQKFSDDPHRMASDIQSRLKAYLSRYYPDGVVVEAEVSPAQDQVQITEFRVNLGITIIFKIGDKEYIAPHQLSLIDSKFNSFTRINNG